MIQETRRTHKVIYLRSYYACIKRLPWSTCILFIMFSYEHVVTICTFVYFKSYGVNLMIPFRHSSSTDTHPQLLLFTKHLIYIDFKIFNIIMNIE